MLIEINDTEGKSTGKQRILNPVFDQYNKEVGDGRGIKRINTFAYEIKTSPENATMLKTLLCKYLQMLQMILNDIKFVPYGLYTLTKKKLCAKL